MNIDSSKLKENYAMVADEYKDNALILIILSWVVVVFVFLRVKDLFSQHGGFVYFSHPDYEGEMAKGVAAHMIQVGRVCFLFLIFIYSKTKYKKTIIITLIGLFIAIAAIQIKYHILWVLLMAFFFLVLKKPLKSQLKILGIAAIVMLLVFNLFWVVISISLESHGISNELVFKYILNQTANYLFTGPILLDHWLSHPAVKPDWTIIVVFKNIYYTNTGSPIRIDQIPLVNLGFEKVTPLIWSNVGTAYGVYALIGGWPLTISASAVTGFLYYMIYFLSSMKYSSILIFFNLMFLTLGILTFFVQYITSLSLYEFPLIFLTLATLLKLINFAKEKLILKERIPISR